MTDAAINVSSEGDDDDLVFSQPKVYLLYVYD